MSPRAGSSEEAADAGSTGAASAPSPSPAELAPRAARCWLELDRDAIEHNARAIRERAGVPLVAVVKANGYGHGAVEVARAALAGGARGLGVATGEEALTLRAAGVEAPIQVLGSFLPDELPLLVEARAAITLHEAEDVERVRKAALSAGRPLPVQLKVDVGMARHGVAVEDALKLLKTLHHDPGLRVEGLMSHLPCATAPDLSTTRAQVARFAELVEAAPATGCLPPQVHAAATAATFRLPEARFNQVRAGIGLVGVDPAECLGPTNLRPALSLRARVTRTRRVKTGDPVGYGSRWVAERETQVALLGIGYGDGIPYAWTQAAGEGELEVLLHGRRCPVIASVMMDYMAIDVTDLPTLPQPGAIATLVGQDGSEQLGLAEQAAKGGLIPYALSCGLGARVQRVQRQARAAAPTRTLRLTA